MRQETIKGYSPNFYPKKGIEKESKLSPSLKKLIASVAILGVLGTLTYIGVKSMGNKEVSVDTPENPIEEQIPTAAPQEQNIVSNPNNSQAEPLIRAICKDTSECVKQQELADKYSESLFEYKNMSITEFEKLSDNDRLAYGDFLVDINNAYNSYYKQGSDAFEFKVTPNELNLDSSGQDILDNFTYRTQLTRLQTDIDKTQPADSMFYFNKDNAQKLLSSIYTTDPLTAEGETVSVVTSETYKKEKEKLNERSSSTWMNDKSIEEHTYKTTAVNTGGVDHQEKLISYKTSGGDIKFAVFRYASYKSYDGSEKNTWILRDKYNDEKEVPKFYLAR